MQYQKRFVLFVKKTPSVLQEPTCISAANIGGTAIHSALEIKSGEKISGSSGKAKASLRNKLSEVKLLMTPEW